MNAEKTIEELTYSDDFMFNQVMQNDKICTQVLERLLKIKIDHIERVSVQKEIRPLYKSKSIKLDVYVKDSNRVFDIDMQCKNDPIGKELPVYTFLETCQEEKSILLNDGTHKYFFNADGADSEKDVELKAFLNYIKTGTASDELTDEIDFTVAQIKQNEAVKELYMIESCVITDAIEEGAERKAIEAAKAFYKNGVSITIIAKSLNMTEDEVKKIVQDPVTQLS